MENTVSRYEWAYSGYSKKVMVALGEAGGLEFCLRLPNERERPELTHWPALRGSRLSLCFVNKQSLFTRLSAAQCCQNVSKNVCKNWPRRQIIVFQILRRARCQQTCSALIFVEMKTIHLLGPSKSLQREILILTEMTDRRHWRDLWRFINRLPFGKCRSTRDSHSTS